MSLGRVVYAGLFGLAAAAAFGKTLVYASVLQPPQFGVVMLALLIATLGSYPATMGILEGLACEVPLRRGANSETVSLRSSAMTAVLLFAICVGSMVTLACLVATCFANDLAGLSWAGLLLVGTVLFNGMICDLQVRERSTEYAAVLALKSLLAAAFAFFVNGRFGAAGVIWAEIGALIICALMILRTWSLDLRLSVGPRESVLALVKLGLPFSISNVLQNLAINVDRWAVQLTLGVAALGTYAFALHFVSIGLVLLNMVHLYAAPKILREYGAGRDGRLALRRTTRLATKTLLMCALGAVPFVLLFPYLITTWYPEYLRAVDLTTWVYVGSAAATVGFFDILFRVLGNGRPLMWIQAGAALSVVIVCIALSWAGSSLPAYAATFAGGRVMSAGLGWYLGIRQVRQLAGTPRVTT